MEAERLGAGPAAEVHVSCGDGDPCAEDWARYKSGFDRYREADMFGDELLQEVGERSRRDRLLFRATPYLFAASVIIFILAIAHDHLGWDTPSQIAVAFLNWLCRQNTWLCYPQVVTALMMQVASLLFGIGLLSLVVIELYWDRLIYREIIEALKKGNLDNARLIFAGGGQLRFSTGDCGVAVAGGNFDFNLSWAAIESASLVKKKPWTYWDVVPEFAPDVAPKLATHLVIRLKRARTDDQSRKAKRAMKKLGRNRPLTTNDILVIPEHFFHAPQDGNTWKEFLRFVHQHVCVGGWMDD